MKDPPVGGIPVTPPTGLLNGELEYEMQDPINKRIRYVVNVADPGSVIRRR